MAFEAVAGNGLSSMDEITITVNDVAPTGSVTLAPSEPDGSPQLLEDGSPVYFQVSGMGGTDPALPPSLWADWDGTGNYELVDSSELINPAPGGGTVTALFSHTYDDAGPHDPHFKIEDAEGLATSTDVPVVLADVPPTATLVLPTAPVYPGQVVTLSLSNVIDPSQAKTDAGFTYSFQVKNPAGVVVATQTSDSPDLEMPQLAPGTKYTVTAEVMNASGVESQVYTGTFQVLSDQVVRNGGTGFSLLQWVTTDGKSGSYVLPPVASYQFVNEIANMSVTLMSDGAMYDLATNFRFDAVEGQNFSNVTLTIGTDNFSNLPNVYGPNATQQTASVGDGFIGQVNIGGTNATVSIYSRGDFQGLNAPNARAQVLSFINDLGSINADSAGNISCTGTLKNFGFAHGVDNIAANSVIVDGSCTRTDPNSINPTLTLTYRQNGGLVVTGSSNIGVTFGNQPRSHVSVGLGWPRGRLHGFAERGWYGSLCDPAIRSGDGIGELRGGADGLAELRLAERRGELELGDHKQPGLSAAAAESAVGVVVALVVGDRLGGKGLGWGRDHLQPGVERGELRGDPVE